MHFITKSGGGCSCKEKLLCWLTAMAPQPIERMARVFIVVQGFKLMAFVITVTSE